MEVFNAEDNDALASVIERNLTCYHVYEYDWIDSAGKQFPVVHFILYNCSIHGQDQPKVIERKQLNYEPGIPLPSGKIITYTDH